jgi:hypothetical protein
METNKATHMLEPWTESAKEIDGEPTDVNYRSIKAGCGYYNEGDELKGFELTGWISPEYSARIVACVNACAGIENPESFMQVVKKLELDAYQKIEAQRDELLAALKRLYDSIDSCVDLTPELLQEIKIAIANAEKGGCE